MKDIIEKMKFSQNSFKQFIVESSKEKINNAGKKKLTKLIDSLIKDLDNLEKNIGIVHDDGEQVYSDCIDTIWTWVDDNNIVNWSTKDNDTINFINAECLRLVNAICDKYNL